MADQDSLLKLLADYPILLDGIKILAGAYIPTAVSSFKLGAYRERIKMNAVNLFCEFF